MRIGQIGGVGRVASAVGSVGAGTKLILSASSVLENSAPGTIIGALSVDSPPDGVTYSYALTGDASGFFEVAGSTLQLAAGAYPDYENLTAHAVEVTATGSDASEVVGTFTIAVGNEVDQQIYTALGAITAGDVVVLNGDGTVSVVSSSLQPGTQTSIKTVQTVATHDTSVAYDPANDLWVVAWCNNNENGQVATLKKNGSTMDVGTPVDFSAGLTRDFSLVYHEAEGKMVIIHANTSDANNLYSTQLAISGTTIIPGTAVKVSTYSSAYEFVAAYHPVEQVILTLSASDGGGRKCILKSLDINGTGFTLGAELSLYSNYVGGLSLACSNAVSQCVLTYHDDYSGGYTILNLVNISGTASVTLEDSTTLVSAYTGAHSAAFHEASGNYLLAYSNSTAGNAVVQMIDVSANSLVLGTAVIHQSAYSSFHAVGVDNGSGEFAVMCIRADRTRWRKGTIAGLVITLVAIDGDDYTDGDDGAYCAMGSSPDGVCLFWLNTFFGTRLKAFQYAGAQNASNASSWTGIAATSAADGASVTVDKPGGSNLHQTGLTPGQDYYVQDDGQLGTTANARLVGPALSPNEIRLEP